VAVRRREEHQSSAEDTGGGRGQQPPAIEASTGPQIGKHLRTGHGSVRGCHGRSKVSFDARREVVASTKNEQRIKRRPQRNTTTTVTEGSCLAHAIKPYQPGGTYLGLSADSSCSRAGDDSSLPHRSVSASRARAPRFSYSCTVLDAPFGSLSLSEPVLFLARAPPLRLTFVHT
jgi:hypothetical protein